MGKEGAKWIFEDGEVAVRTENKLGWAIFHCSNCGHKEYLRDGMSGFHVPIGIVFHGERVSPIPWRYCPECKCKMINCDFWMENQK